MSKYSFVKEIPIKKRFPVKQRIFRMSKGPLFYSIIFILFTIATNTFSFALSLLILFGVIPYTVLPLIRSNIPYKISIDFKENELEVHFLKYSFFNRCTKIPFKELYYNYDFTGNRITNYSLKHKGLEIWKNKKMIVIIFENPELGWYPEEVNEVYKELLKTFSPNNNEKKNS